MKVKGGHLQYKGAHEELARPIHIRKGVQRKVTSTRVYRIRKGGQELFLVIRREAHPGQFAHPKVRAPIRHGYAQGSETNKERSKHGTRSGQSTQWNDVSANSK